SCGTIGGGGRRGVAPSAPPVARAYPAYPVRPAAAARWQPPRRRGRGGARKRRRPRGGEAPGTAWNVGSLPILPLGQSIDSRPHGKVSSAVQMKLARSDRKKSGGRSKEFIKPDEAFRSRSAHRRRGREPKVGSPPLFALAMDLAAVRLDDAPRDGEAETGAAHVLSPRHLVERLADPLEGRGGDARARGGGRGNDAPPPG